MKARRIKGGKQKRERRRGRKGERREEGNEGVVRHQVARGQLGLQYNLASNNKVVRHMEC